MTLTIENVLSLEQLSKIRALMAQSQWIDGDASAGSVAAIVKNNQQIAQSDPRLGELQEFVLDALNRVPLFFSAALPLKILPPQFNRYQGATNHYGFHTDNAMQRVPNRAGVYVRADISATLFLSDPDDYDGGELTIVDAFGNHGVKLPAGSLVLYPSSSVHSVTPVSRGERIACFMFIQSMVRDADKRRLLYEMDMALLALRAEGNTGILIEPVMRLTGTYHNLLRRWAET
jgi:PKHD-type hydroxylase